MENDSKINKHLHDSLSELIDNIKEPFLFDEEFDPLEKGMKNQIKKEDYLLKTDKKKE